MDYIDNVLIKLSRKYSKDETVSALSKKLEISEIQNGKLISEIHYLEFKLKENIDKDQENKLARIEARKTKIFQNSLSQNKKLNKQVSELRKLRGELFSKINKLEKDALNVC